MPENNQSLINQLLSAVGQSLEKTGRQGVSDPFTAVGSFLGNLTGVSDYVDRANRNALSQVDEAAKNIIGRSIFSDIAGPQAGGGAIGDDMVFPDSSPPEAGAPSFSAISDAEAKSIPNLSEIIQQADRTGDVISLRGNTASLSKDKTKGASIAAEGSSERATKGFTDPLINLQRDLQEQERLKDQTNTANALSTVLDTFEAQSSDETLKARIAQIRDTLARDPAQAPILLREILPLALKGLTLATG